ncbi:hypothetical protein LTR62_004795 [Meristemomyces frigidus]|uniref:LysM domain-containing protein n=1 Tax=Meristemomyces frigidus TaxID=1508187 RepID=A0AAN7TG81_9PEZI|nr:hypothetical protein LTR62_004795 [Meristemomyces frigidus]
MCSGASHAAAWQAMQASNARTSSTPATTSSLRPRTNRLISGLGDGDETIFDAGTTPLRRVASPLPSPFDGRSASPIPSTRLSRPTSSHDTQSNSTGGSLGRSTLSRQRKGETESPTLSGLWGNSWTTLQGIASDLLSGDPAADAKRKPGRSKTGLNLIGGSQYLTSAPPNQWGPNTPTSHATVRDVGGGTKDKQLAALRAQKRRDMLTRQEPSHADTLGKFKRRMSDDRASLSAPPGDNEDRKALVYVHHVQENDTLAGITIKYNCTASVVRKANRMWPNDTIHSRETLILPVDACGAKGRMMPGSEALDLLSSDADALSAGQAEEVGPLNEPPNGNIATRNRTDSQSTDISRRASSSVARSSAESEPSWHHDSWVLLPGASKPTEIARLSRRALGYFPPARRKSNCFSEFNTPSTSLDLARTTTHESMSTSPLRQEPPQRPQRTRRLSNATTGYFPSYLSGPGGVGTMNRNVRFPGPAQDGLNKMFAKHLPDVAPPRSQQSLLTPEFPLYTDDVTPLASGASTPGGRLSSNLKLENMGGAIESWMRKTAGQVQNAMQQPERQKAARASVGAPGRGAGGIGDLIEMTDEFEIGDDFDDYEEEGRGRQGSAIYLGQNESTGASYFDGVGARERSGGGKSGKAD